MGNQQPGTQPILSQVEPVVVVTDVAKTIRYWQKTLGFPHKWTWGKPPTHGGVSWNNVFIQFSLNPDLAKVSHGHSIWIKVQRLEALYALHQKKKAEIVSPLQNRPWGMADYIVREINGYFLTFSAPVTDREKSGATEAPAIRIVERSPTIEEYRYLVSAVEWVTSETDAIVEAILLAAIFAVVAEDTANDTAVGCALLLGDKASFYYVKDVMVVPAWQGKHVGTALMNGLNAWLERNAPDNALVGLFTGENLATFYQQFGFAPGYGMYRRIQKDKEDMP